jgi:hypothetical protein
MSSAIMPQNTAVIACTRFLTISSRVGSAHLVVAPKKICLRHRVLTKKCFCEYVVNQAMLQGWFELISGALLSSFPSTKRRSYLMSPQIFLPAATISCLAAFLPAPGDTQGNASRQLVVVVGFGRRVAPALWRLTFETLIFWMSLIVGGSALAVGAYPQATCRSWGLAAVVSEVGAVFEYPPQLTWAVYAVKTRDCVVELISQILGLHGDLSNPRDRDF